MSLEYRFMEVGSSFGVVHIGRGVTSLLWVQKLRLQLETRIVQISHFAFSGVWDWPASFHGKHTLSHLHHHMSLEEERIGMGDD